MLNNLERARVLSDALPFIQRFYGRTIVVKYGGAAMKNLQLKSKVIEDILFLSYIGIRIVIVHGGGPMINNWLKKIDIEPKFLDGIRITDKATMEVVEMVLVGKVNKDLVTLLNLSCPIAVGLSGKDANLITASSLFINQIDNYTGKVEQVNVKIIDLLLDQGYIPVIASVAADLNGQAYNINADTVAGSIAEHLHAEKLVLLTDTPGIMKDINCPSTLIKYLNIQEAEKLKKDQVILGGMIPKVDCCIKALRNNVNAAHIINGSVEHALLLEILTSDGIGSMLIA
uniref:Acetylglutamate kinase n=2 Tax=Gracilariopsis TaxID=2781 RepID=A0A1C9CF64_9FLOR|nr:acetylglutamate kinase [Gracilariopsis lemaneiformis]YP_009294763.1 acetylglutamate kinase [Gracilariopsis chorda]AJO68404.1 acetylglutamate kinase [Gracilariopsis lemaneiformis]AML79778.1 acetylglutamate kinase [Gracilariopsis lemaneiformis]AOM67023.1 acetylglutamate kinase [Gracilariopsis chorda]